ncbi:MAG: carbohydrate kinase family protein [Promethearchaeota archaeon]|nr:MAG: carbohydrate kinase family protein [Candidatus Lokiarchaeota archaeon]
MNYVDIVGLGEVVVDWVMEVPHYPQPDEKINALSENRFSGGVTANFLAGVAKLDVKCGFIGAVGDDSYGDFLISDFKKERVDTSYLIKKKEKKTPINFIFISKGEKTIIQSPHMKTTKIEISDISNEYIKNSKLLHTTLIHQDISKYAIDLAKSNDVKISIDLESQIAERGWNNLKESLLKADILIPNKEGAKKITKTSNPEDAANLLIKKGIPKVIITLGSEGALLTTDQIQKRIPAFRMNNIVDTTGAGDVFNAAFSVGHWINNWDLERACKFANAAAALKIQHLGARSGIPSKEMVLEFIESQNT